MPYNKVKRVRYIEVKRKSDLILEIQDSILRHTTAGLISASIHWNTRNFIDSLKYIPLSEELQTSPKIKGKKIK